jgi:hypothetical protein
MICRVRVGVVRSILVITDLISNRVLQQTD